jgi:hypothetical protein
MKLFADGQMALRMAEKTVKSVVERIGNILCTAIATEVGISPASVFHILTNSLGKEKFVQSGFHTSWTMNKEPCVVHTTLHLQCWRHEGNEFLNCIFATEKSQMNSFDP